MITKFIQEAKLRNLSHTTLRIYVCVLKTILKVENNTYEQVVNIITNDKLKANSQQLYKNIYSEYLKFIDDYANVKRLKQLKLKRPDVVFFKTYTKQQIEQITTINPNDNETLRKYKILALFLFQTGIRVGEINTLTKQGNNLYVIGKGNKLRQIFYNENTYNLFKHYWPKPRTQPSYWTAINKVFNGQLSPHGLRRSFATHMLNNGANIKSVMFQLGHNKVETTLRYLHNDLNYHQQEYFRLM